MDELVELLEFLLIVNFLGMRGDGTQTVHDVILHKHRGITPHGKGDGIAGASVQYMLAIFAKNNNRRIKHRRLSAHDLDSLELSAQGDNSVKQQVMGNRTLGTTDIDTAANRGSLK